MCTKVVSMPINAIIVEMEWRDIRFAQRISTASCGESLTFNDLTECVVARIPTFIRSPHWVVKSRVLSIFQIIDGWLLFSADWNDSHWSPWKVDGVSWSSLPRAESCILRAILVAWTIRANWLWTLHCWVICRSERTIVSPSATPICLFCPITSPTQCITRLCS